jgi:hypothetical protein
MERDDVEADKVAVLFLAKEFFSGVWGEGI